jgi:DNA invertase Pin-like site-specific DNA recombinase
MKVALYARVSTDAQEARGTIGSQLEVLRARASGESHDIVAEFLDDGHSGARLDRPGLDALRDAAEGGLFDAVWCLSPDRLARVYAYQVVVLDELARHGVRMLFSDSPAMDDDPQARLLTQVQGVIAEYERAKIAERYRRGKLYRSRAGEVIHGRHRTATDVSSAARTVPPISSSSNQRPKSSGASSMITFWPGTRRDRSSSGFTATVSHRLPARRCGVRRRSGECLQTRHTSGAFTTTAPSWCRPRTSGDATTASCLDPGKNGSPSQCRRSSRRTSSRPRNE